MPNKRDYGEMIGSFALWFFAFTLFGISAVLFYLAFTGAAFK